MADASNRPTDAQAGDVGAPRAQSHPLGYALPDISARRPGMTDPATTIIGLLQSFMALFPTIAMLWPDSGHNELRDPTFLKRLAWGAAGGSWMFCVWAAGSLTTVVGAFGSPARRRRRYLLYVAAFVACAITYVAGMAATNRLSIQERWVPPSINAEPPWDWHSVVYEGGDYFGIVLMLLITNPVILLFGYRLVNLRPIEGDIPEFFGGEDRTRP